MSDYTGFNPKTLSDEQLLTQSSKLLERLNWDNRFGTGALSGQLLRLLEMINQERWERTLGQGVPAAPECSGPVNETDPVLRAAMLAAATPAPPQAAPLMNSRRSVPIPTTTPVPTPTTAPVTAPAAPARRQSSQPKHQA